MSLLNKEIREYREQLRKGHIQKAYKTSYEKSSMK